MIEKVKLVSVDYVVGDSKPSITEAIRLCLAKNNAEAFMRFFMLIAFASMISPNTQIIHLIWVFLVMKLAYIKQYDWTSFAFEYIR